MWTPFARLTPIAVDLGTGSLRAVQLERANGRVTVRRWLRHVESPAGGDGEEPSDGQSSFPNVPIREQEGFTGNEMVVSLGLPEVECCPLRVPDSLLKLDRESLFAALRHEVAGQLSSPIESVELDFWRLVPTRTDGPNLMVAAAATSAIRRIIDWADGQKLVCQRIDLSPLTTMRACETMVASPQTDCIRGVLDLGRRASRLYIGIGGIPVYVRRIQRGGDSMTHRIAEELDVSWSIAERYKKRYGIAGPDTGYRPLLSADNTAAEQRMSGILQGVLSPIIHGLCEEINSSFHYAMEYYPGRPVGGLTLVGGGAGLKGLSEKLRELLGIEVGRPSAAALPETLAPLSALPEDVLAEMVDPIGLGLAEVNG